MKEALKTIVPYILTAIIFVLIYANYVQVKTQKKQSSENEYELVETLDSITTALESTSRQRDTLLLHNDSLVSINQALAVDLKKSNETLRSIKNRYRNWSSDSLANEMNRRAGQIN